MDTMYLEFGLHTSCLKGIALIIVVWKARQRYASKHISKSAKAKKFVELGSLR
jgi:hypothetical protein